MKPPPLRLDAWRPWLALAVAIGALVRFSSVLGSDFPAGDGGLVASSIQDVRDAGFALPVMASYNGGEIPFAYPPLAFYLGAVLPVPPLLTLQWLPPLLATATLLPTFAIGRRVGGPSTGLAATAFLALSPFAWYWLVQGGGLTRALALLLGLSAVAAATAHRGIFTGVFGGLTALTHPEAAIFAAVTTAAVLAFDRAWRPMLIAAAVSLFVVLPWLVLVVVRHGSDPILAAAGARSVNPLAAVLSISGDRPGMLDLAAAIGLIGLLATSVRWLLVSSAVVALLLTTSIGTHLAPLLALGTGATVAANKMSRPLLAATASLLVLGSAVTIGNPEPLSADQRAAMGWAAAETPEDARFAVVSEEVWSRAIEAEWFPHLADRVSVTTMQGREWLPDWRAIDARNRELRACTDANCVDEWATKEQVDYLYLTADCCPDLRAAITDAPIIEFGRVLIVRIDGD